MINAKNAFIVALIAIVIAIGGYFFPQINAALGGVTTGTAFPHGVSIGLASASPSNIAKFAPQTCSLIVSQSTNQPASTTYPYDCAVTGVTSSDRLVAMFATTTPHLNTDGTIGRGWTIDAAGASTTAGYVTVLLFNGNGTAADPQDTGIASTTVIMPFLNQ